MKTIKLNTGVKITFDKLGNMLEVDSPYYNDDPVFETTLLRYFVNEIKKIIQQ